MCDLIASVPDHCLSFNFKLNSMPTIKLTNEYAEDDIQKANMLIVFIIIIIMFLLFLKLPFKNQNQNCN